MRFYQSAKHGLLILGFLLTFSSVNAQSFTNPIMGGDNPDPSVVRVGNDYYMTFSSFNYVPALGVFHSRDLVNWTPISSAVNTYLGSVWAPDICYNKSKFYIYFTVDCGAGGNHNFVVWAEHPQGPWSKPVDLQVTGPIDPCHVVDEATGNRWMFLSGGRRVRLSADGLSTIGKVEKVFDGWPIPRDWVVEGFALEGPKVRRIGNYYYWLSAQGGTAGAPTSHMITVAHSKSIDGPWELMPTNPLVHTWNYDEAWWSKGHGSLIDTPDGRWYTVFHAYRRGLLSRGRQALLLPVEQTSDGWFTAPMDTLVDRPLPLPIPSSKNQSVQGRHSDWGAFWVGPDWRFYQNYDSTRFHVADRTLTLEARGDNPANSSPLLMVAPDSGYEITVRIDLDSTVTAGLVCYYDEHFYVGTGVSRTDRKRWRRGELRRVGQHESHNTIWLRLRNDRDIVSGEYSFDGHQWKQDQWGMEVSGYNQNTLGQFQSLLPGLFVYGKGKARFSELQYRTIRR